MKAPVKNLNGVKVEMLKENQTEDDIGEDQPDVTEEDLFNFNEQNPSNWNVQEADETLIFKNTVTGRVFEGTIQEFNKVMQTSRKA